jgi:NADPH-dependent 2,4-dienoyl-CoA reductase/sulfur reductase-like enzyme
MSSLRKQFGLLVVGGGPAGIAAAATAAEAGVRVGIVDDNPALGGQIWRSEQADSGSEASAWMQRVNATAIEFVPGVRIVHHPETSVLRGEGRSGSVDFVYRKLILATGARERFLPFPGWTLQNVMGAGALQALVKCGLPIQGKRVVVAGTGPLLLAVAAYLRKAGANVLLICEQASRFSLVRFGARLLIHRSKVAQALSLRKDLAGVRFLTSAWPIAAEGHEVLRSVVIRHGDGTETVNCDYLACGFHLVPNTELASLLGCRVQAGRVSVDDFQTTSRTNIFCAGEPTGVGGVELALVQGQIAGLATVGQEDRARKLFPTRRRLRNYADALDRTFVLRPELKQVAQPQTIVCRCEDVTYRQLARHRSWRSAKLQTRCGMGPCQGRVCGPALEFMLGWAPDSVRPPVFPALLSTLAGAPRPESDPIASGVMRGHQ